jgi:hypothetical protein
MDGEDFKAAVRDAMVKKLGRKGTIAHSTLSVTVGPYPDKLLRAFMSEVSRARRSEEAEV